MVEQDFNGEFLPDWADKRAREWWTGIDLDMMGNNQIEASLAALLREVNREKLTGFHEGSPKVTR